MAERESPEHWAGTASRPRVTSQHHVISPSSERLSSCLASPELGTFAGGDDHLGSASILAGCAPRVGSASPLGHPCEMSAEASRGTAHPRLILKPRVQDAQPGVAVPGTLCEGLAAWGCFPCDSQHSSQVSGSRRTPRQPSPSLPSP